MDDAAFFVDFLGGERQIIRPVVEDEQAGVDDAVACDGNIADVVHRFVYRCVGVQVFAEAHADGFQVMFQSISGEMSSAVEAHVFQEVCQPSLIVFFKDGTHFLGDVEVGAVFRQFIVPDVVSQPVF